MFKKSILLSSLLLTIVVIFGAFGAHGLAEIVDDKGILIWNKAVNYQFIHAFGILIVGIVSKLQTHKMLNYAMNLFLLGIVFFSGSLYLLTFKEQLSWVKMVGPITPIGGLMFMAGWICLFMYALKYKENEQ